MNLLTLRHQRPQERNPVPNLLNLFGFLCLKDLYPLPHLTHGPNPQ